jgi:hypothetical protein
VREEPPRPQLQELVALAAVAALRLYLLAHGEITAVVGEMASQTAAVATALAGQVRLGLRAALALAGAGMAVRAAAWLLNRWEGHR